MRQRERLEDFRGGHVACRGCRRLLYFDPEALRHGSARVFVCCGLAYAPERARIDVVIYDRLDDNAFPEEWHIERPGPVAVHASEDPVLDPTAPEPEDESEGDIDIDEEEIAAMAATQESVEARHADRVATLRARQGR